MHKRLFGIAAIAWTLVIAVLCLVSSNAFSDIPTPNIPHKDKYVHFFLYFMFTLLWYFFMKNCTAVSRKKIMAVIFTVAFSYGVVIEILQALIAHKRGADVFDALANAAGSATAIMVVWLFERNK